MELSRQGLEELFSDGVVNPAAMSGPYLKNCTKFKELGSRVFLLYEPDPELFPSNAEFDIILLHGIGSDEFNCWTNAQGIVWPAVFLPQDFPTARIVTVGYEHSLFNWKAEESEAVETAAEGPSVLTSSASAVSAEKAGQTEDESGALHHIKSIADKVGQSAKETVSTHAPPTVTDWWAGSSSAQSGEKQTTTKTATPEVSVTAVKEEGKTKDGGDKPLSQSATPQNVDNPLFQLLTRIRDSTGSLVAAEDEAGAASLSGSNQATGGATRTSDRRASRDVRSLQNMRIVAAELAERLGSAEVGVGQRPVVFLVHSMGGLILKQMLISLFEAARLAPPSAAALSLASASQADSLTTEETALSRNCAAVRKANVLLRAVRGVVFYGTPHFGSAVASVITGLQKYYQGLGGLTPTSVVTGLGDHNKQELLRLNDRFFDVVERLGEELHAEVPDAAAPAPQSSAALKDYMAAMEASLAPVQGAWNAGIGPAASADHGGGEGETPRGMVWILSFGETKKLNGLVRVVDPESANPAPDDPRYPFYLVNADHGEVCRPLTKMSPSYAMVYGLLDRMQQRGLLKWPREQSIPKAPQGGTPHLATPSGEGAARVLATTQQMCEEYESGWSALFDVSRPPSTTLVHQVADTSAPTPPPSAVAHTRASAEWQRDFEAFQRGVGDMRVALPVLEEALADLHHLLHNFFGVAVPPQLDSIFLLAADVTDFVTRFYRREALIVEGAAHEVAGSSASTREDVSENDILVDQVVSFHVPLQLLTYWVQQAAGLLRVFELNQQERSIGVGAVNGASPTAARWESNLSTHPGGRDLRELSELEQSVGVVQEEWESFRRYVSMQIRAVSPTGGAQGTSPKRPASRQQQDHFHRSSEPGGIAVREHIAALFFARAIRTVVSQHLLDGGALGGLLGAYLRSAVLQVRGSEGELSSTSFQHNPWASLGDAPSLDSASIVALVMEGLDLSISASPASEDSSVLTDTSGSGVRLNSNVELHAIVPALTATSSMLLGCFALFVDELHRLDGGARLPRAAEHFELSASALRADFHVRSRLLRAASRTMQKEGLVSSPSPNGDRKAGAGEKEWWKSAWEMTASKSASSDARGSVAGTTADGRQGHVAKLDDGLFLSAMQLVAASFQSSILIQACHARRALLDKEPTEGKAVRERCQEAQRDAAPPARESESAPVTPTDATADDLVRSIEIAQAAYTRTANILRGVVVLSDTEKPFAPPQRQPRSDGTGKAEGSGGQKEKSRKDLLRDAIHGILSELDQDDGEEASAQADTDKKVTTKPRVALSWTSRSPTAAKEKPSSDLVPKSTGSTAVQAATAPLSKKKGRKNSLPMLIINSLSKAWDAVRSGGAEAETPEHFAYTALVMWWMVEGEAIAVLDGAAAVSRAPSTAVARTKLTTLRDRMERTLLRRGETATKAPSSAPSSLKPSADPTRAPALPSQSEEKEKAWEHRCWSNANVATQCKWMTLRGGEEFLCKFHRELRTEQETLEKIVTSTSPARLRACEESFEPPAVLLQLDGDGGAQLGIPSSLLDAVQHDDTSAALRCWLGHCYAVHRMRSPDTAHAYAQVIRNDYAAHKRYTPTAEVGLAWSHIHSVSCSFAQLWRVSGGASRVAATVPPTSAAKEQPRLKGCPEARTAAALLNFGATGVVDSSALHTVSPQLLHFCHGAVLHHTSAVDEYLRVQSTSPSPSSGAHRGQAPGSSLSHTWSLQCPPAHVGSLRHLRLAEAGFRRALIADPASVGALCGIGRLRCLSVTSPQVAGAASPHAWTPFSDEASASARQRVGGVSVAEPVGFFRAALDAADHKRLLPTAELAPRLASPESCAQALDRVWLSYAAYWMSEEAHRSRVNINDSGRETHEAEAAAEATEWLLTSLRYYPRNDWALTSLGLSNLAESTTPPQSLHAKRGPVRDDRSTRKSDSAAEVSQLRGLALLQRALAINPTNMWALWGIGTYGTSEAHRSTCQRLLRRLVLRNIPRV